MTFHFPSNGNSHAIAWSVYMKCNIRLILFSIWITKVVLGLTWGPFWMDPPNQFGGRNLSLPLFSFLDLATCKVLCGNPRRCLVGGMGIRV